MKLVIIVKQQKNGKTEYVEHQVGYGTAIRMVLLDIVRRIGL